MHDVGVGLELGVEPDVIRVGLAQYSGVDRRFQVRGEQAGVTVVDDYGHHPTEIRATLAAAQSESTLHTFQSTSKYDGANASSGLIADSHGIQFLVRDMRTLDKHSRRLLDRFL